MITFDAEIVFSTVVEGAKREAGKYDTFRISIPMKLVRAWGLKKGSKVMVGIKV